MDQVRIVAKVSKAREGDDTAVEALALNARPGRYANERIVVIPP